MARDQRTNVTIGELIASGAIIAHKDGNYGSKYPRVDEFGSDGVPFLTAKSLRGGYVDIAGAPRLADARANDLTFGFVEPGDVLLSHNATIGRVAVVPPYNGRLLVGTSLTYFRLDTKKLLPRYLAVYMAGSNFQHQLAAVMSHSTRNQVPVTTQRNLHVVVPPLAEQRAIAQILGTLDDKIEMNRRMSETLEAMARALFKSWFVDFDPVRAKAEGRDPGLPKHIADLFPARLVGSELGEIPEGWEVGALGDVADHPRRTARPVEIDPQTPYIALEHMPKRCIALPDWNIGEGLESNKFRFNRGEILFGKLRPYFHKVGVAPIDGVCSTDIVVVVPQASEWFGFVLGHTSSTEFVDFTDAGSTGTKMPRTSWKEMARYEIVLPPRPVAAAFDKLIQPAINRVIAGIHESHTLAALRDTLLPRLISGELRVEHAEKLVERVGT